MKFVHVRLVTQCQALFRDGNNNPPNDFTKMLRNFLLKNLGSSQRKFILLREKMRSWAEYFSIFEIVNFLIFRGIPVKRFFFVWLVNLLDAGSEMLAVSTSGLARDQQSLDDSLEFLFTNTNEWSRKKRKHQETVKMWKRNRIRIFKRKSFEENFPRKLMGKSFCGMKASFRCLDLNKTVRSLKAEKRSQSSPIKVRSRN